MPVLEGHDSCALEAGGSGDIFFFHGNGQALHSRSAAGRLQILDAFPVKVNTLAVPIFSRDNRCNANAVLTVVPATENSFSAALHWDVRNGCRSPDNGCTPSCRGRPFWFVLAEPILMQSFGELTGQSHPSSSRLPSFPTESEAVALPSSSLQMIAAVPEATDQNVGAPWGWVGCRNEGETPWPGPCPSAKALCHQHVARRVSGRSPALLCCLPLP